MEDSSQTSQHINKKANRLLAQSNMHMYYAFGNHIYTFSSVSHVFLVCQTYFVFLIYASNFF